MILLHGVNECNSLYVSVMMQPVFPIKFMLASIVCMYVRKGWAIEPAPAPRPSTIYCATSTAKPLLILHSEWNVGL
jgi:hypothetical protein